MTAAEVAVAVLVCAFGFTAGRVSLRRAARLRHWWARRTSETCAEVQERMLAQALATPRVTQGQLVPYREPIPTVLEEARPVLEEDGQRDFLSALTAFFRAAKAPTAPVKEQVTLGKPKAHVTAPPDWQAAVREIEGQPLSRDKGCIARQKALEIERDLVARGLLDPHMASGGDERARIDRALGFAAKRQSREGGDV